MDYATPYGVTRLPDLGPLPSSLPELCALVQGIVLHPYWGERYGGPDARTRMDEANVRAAFDRIALVRRLDPAPLTVARPPERRSVGTCRDFTVTLVALLRAKGVSARARCGFARYFEPGLWVDHWVAEVWDADRWRRVDPQLDAFQRDALKIGFDPTDLPDGAFLSGGEAWRLCRGGRANPDTFGIFDLKGWWFIAGDLVRDVAALRKVELLPWDCWGLSDIGPMDSLDDDSRALLDRAAEAPESVWDHPALRVPSTIMSYPEGKPTSIDLPADWLV